MTTRSIPPSYIVVIRTAGERTFEACKALILGQVNEDRLHMVDERPFEAALRRCYQIGIESDAEWMITVDADVLLRDEAIEGLLAEATAMPGDHFQIEGMVFDKLTNRARWAGYRCYRVQYLAAAERLLPPDRVRIRPESATIHRFAENGHPFRRSDCIYGIHDFEQYYLDIYRKAFLHANKHTYLLGELLPWWREQAKMDADYRVALRGGCEGLQADTVPTTDIRGYIESSEQAIRKLGFVEKGPIDTDAIGAAYVETCIFRARASGAIREQEAASRWGCLQLRYKRLGAWRFWPHLFGAAMCDLGGALKRAVEK